MTTRWSLDGSGRHLGVNLVNLGVDTLKKVCYTNGQMNNNDALEDFHFRWPQGTKCQLKIAAALAGKSMSQLVYDLLVEGGLISLKEVQDECEETGQSPEGQRR